MPLYEFKCPEGHEFEKFYRSIGTARTEESCPECGAVAARRISPAGLVFKGSGFYITDYGKDGKKAERESATKPEKGEKPAEAPAKPAADAAPAPKTEPKPEPAKSPTPAPAKSE